MDFKRLSLNLKFANKSSEENSSPYPGQVKRFSLRELRAATENFNTKNILGRGGFGVVYKGNLSDGSQVAIKRLLKEKITEEGLLQFQTEVEMISRALHRNLLRLYGFCITPKERLLIYPYMVNGSVASRLKGRLETHAPLDWQTRKCIAYGAANALMYLHDHCHPKIIHRDVKADNILLNEDFEAVVGDFGLAKFVDYKESHVTTDVCGTFGHIAPEYFTNLRCSEKTDVYGYGILLLELITGRRVYNIIPPSKREEGVLLFEWIDEALEEKKLELLIDSDLYGSYNCKEAEDMIHVAMQCIRHSPKERPLMSNIVRMLEDYSLVVKRNWNRQKQRPLYLSKLVFCDSGKQYDVQDLIPQLVGRGRLGTVYKATFSDGYTIAIKMLKDTMCGADSFENYLKLMKKVNHPNILGLKAYSNDRKLLVHEYLPNGSLYTLLHGDRGPGRPPMYWTKRLKLVLEVAKGLAYIHEEYNAVHGNLKSTNVLLDKNGMARIADFGQCLFLNLGHMIMESGTYHAPEQKLSQKADVYSFGILLLEVLSKMDPSQHPANADKEDSEVDFRKTVCSECGGHNLKFDEALLLGLRCTAKSPEKRPAMVDVVREIKGINYRRDPFLYAYYETML